MNNKCYLCQCELTPENNSKEHIIPSSIGGKKKVPNFICKKCNNSTGQTWDKSLANDLQFFTLTSEAKRDRGKTRPIILIGKKDGRKYKLLPSGEVELADIEYKESKTEKGKNIHFSVGNKKLAHRKIKELQRKYPDQPISEDHLTYTSIHQEYHLELKLGGIESGKSLVKTWLALLSDSAVQTIISPHIKHYLESESEIPPWHFYVGDDPIAEISGDNFKHHLVCIEGNKERGYLVGYLRYFGILQCSILLSENYTQRSFQHSYTINTETGTEVKLEYDMELANFNSNPDIQGLLLYSIVEEVLLDFVISPTTIKKILFSSLTALRLNKSKITSKNFYSFFEKSLEKALLTTPNHLKTEKAILLLTNLNEVPIIATELIKKITSHFEENFTPNNKAS